MIDYKELTHMCRAQIDSVYGVNEVVKVLIDCRNELCLKCGRYQEAHLGACKDCRWRD